MTTMRDVFKAHEVALEFVRAHDVDENPLLIASAFQAIEDEDNQLLLVTALVSYLHQMCEATVKRMNEAEDKHDAVKQTIAEHLKEMEAMNVPEEGMKQARDAARKAGFYNIPQPRMSMDSLIDQLTENSQRAEIKYFNKKEGSS